ncbi:MAG: TlyA family RNA methyltransferase [Alphaproteobacteria bacterium]|nr:TlyA family RNA methyltransferase [Alphaproteobacteria bacterium]MCW5744358.1 TlyA family RNA methyltransferase [Alphaproteobacteria bacterium]
MAGQRRRLDRALVTRGLVRSRAEAHRAIEAGLVTVAGRAAGKASEMVGDDEAIVLVAGVHPYVSRGGLKLAHALDHFGIAAAGRLALDVGASTGGFTDVLLRRGARKIYAVDVGHGQLDASLRDDPRVVSLERLNVREIDATHVPEPVGLIVCDVSFIGLRVALPAALALAAPGADLVALIKPQFEVGPSRVGKGGIVRDAVLHEEACSTIRDWLGARPGWSVRGIVDSPIEGGDGNREFLIAAWRR